jgi:hypothetical protein
VRRAALFDLDRTLVRRDTASLYVRYRRDQGEAGWRDALRVAWWLVQYGVGIIDAERVAARAGLGDPALVTGTLVIMACGARRGRGPSPPG